MRILIILFILSCSLTIEAKAKSLEEISSFIKIPRPGQIMMSLPICDLNSSLAQRCKILSKDEKNAHRLYTTQNIKDINLSRTKASIETDDWYYSIGNIEQGIVGFTFDFTDDAKFTTYLTIVKFFVEFNKNTATWEIVGEKLIHNSGSAEEMLDKYIKYDEPFEIELNQAQI